jgi:hypothetical protein
LRLEHPKGPPAFGAYMDALRTHPKTGLFSGFPPTEGRRKIKMNRFLSVF